MPYFETSEGVKLFYEDRGQGAPVVLVHAWSMDHTLWENQVMALMGEFRVIAYDQRGHGRSDAPDLPHDIHALVSDLHALITGLDLQEVRLVGWSLGGFVVQEYMRVHGERVGKVGIVASLPKLVRDDSWPHGLDPVLMGGLATQLASDRAEATEAFYRGLLHEGASKPMLDWIVRVSLQTPLFAAMQAFASCAALDLRDALPQISVPTTVFIGAHDVIPVNGARWMVDQLRNGTLVVFDNSGHFPQLEEAAKLSEALIGFAA